jgi:hypothetical protein
MNRKVRKEITQGTQRMQIQGQNSLRPLRSLSVPCGKKEKN